jgi:hypothetical protein
MLFIGCEDSLEVEKLFVDAEDFPPHPLHPPEDGGGASGEEGGENEPLGGGVQPGGVSVKGPGPVGVIILVQSLVYTSI